MEIRRKEIDTVVPDYLTAGALVDVWAPEQWAALQGVQQSEDVFVELAVQAKMTAQVNYTRALQSWMRTNGITRRPDGVTTIPKWSNR